MQYWTSHAQSTRPGKYVFPLGIIGTLSEINVVAILVFSDGLMSAASNCGTAVITLPNMDFISQLVLGRIEVQLCADSCFRVEDLI